MEPATSWIDWLHCQQAQGDAGVGQHQLEQRRELSVVRRRVVALQQLQMEILLLLKLRQQLQQKAGHHAGLLQLPWMLSRAS
jgi:hypothetical protein